jgi:hypothetical protein
LAKVKAWANKAPPPEDLTDQDLAALFPPSPGS